MAAKNKPKWIIGLFVIALAVIAISFLNLGQNIVYFYTPDEAVAKASELSGQTIKLGAMVVPGTIEWKPENLQLNFKMSDLKGHEVAVTHKGPPPDLFKEGQGVVAEGRLGAEGKTFQATKLMVKHSEEYKRPDGSTVDRKMLEQSMFKE